MLASDHKSCVLEPETCPTVNTLLFCLTVLVSMCILSCVVFNNSWSFSRGRHTGFSRVWSSSLCMPQTSLQIHGDMRRVSGGDGLSNHSPYLPCRLDALPHAEVTEDPGQKQTQREVPLYVSQFLDARRYIEHSPSESTKTLLTMSGTITPTVTRALQLSWHDQHDEKSCRNFFCSNLE